MPTSLASLFCLGLAIAGCGGAPGDGAPDATTPALQKVSSDSHDFSTDGLNADFATDHDNRVPLPADIRPMAGFFSALLALENGKRNSPVIAMHLGDSHTANDRFTGQLRKRFQERFGNAGRGMLPPGKPFDYYNPYGVSVSQEGKWRLTNSFDTDASGIFGVTGYRLRSTGRGDNLTLEADKNQLFDWAEIVLLEQNGGGTLRVRVDGKPLYDLPSGEKAGASPTPVRYQFNVPPHTRSLTVTSQGDGVVDMLGWTIQRKTPGVIYDSQGIIGAQINIMEKWDEKAMLADLRARKPALVVLAYGTNDGFGDKLDRDRYESLVRERLVFLKGAVPNASFLLVGPPDANRYPRRCGKPSQRSQCGPLNASEIANYKSLFSDYPRGRRCRWHPPPKLEVVRQTLNKVAEDMDMLFWDWSKVMGGPCGIHRWTREDKAFGDHVHLKREGYEMSGDQLFDELMQLYERYRAIRQTTDLQQPGTAWRG